MVESYHNRLLYVNRLTQTFSFYLYFLYDYLNLALRFCSIFTVISSYINSFSFQHLFFTIFICLSFVISCHKKGRCITHQPFLSFSAFSFRHFPVSPAKPEIHFLPEPFLPLRHLPVFLQPPRPFPLQADGLS